MTIYTIPDRFLYANTLNRYSMGDRTKVLQFGKDGSVTIYVSNTSPGKTRKATGCRRRRRSAALWRASTGRARRR
jgi:hypothetical protein